MKKTVLLLATAALAVLLASGVYVLGAVDAHATSHLTDKIVWSSFSPDNDTADIYMMNSDGSNQIRLTNTGVGVSEGVPAISPDGTKIAYTRSTDPDVFNNDDIYVMNTDGSNQTRLTSNPGNDQYPDWSPDGKKIVFHNAPIEGPDDIYVMDADGSNQTRLTDWAANPPDGGRPEHGGFQQPTFSPEGNEIALVGGPLDPTNTLNEFAIYIMNADGSNVNLVMRSSGYGFSDPAFSPDGNSIAATRSVAEGTSSDIVLAAVDGSAQRNLTNGGNGLFNGGPTFSPDGTKIAFSSNRDGDGEREIYTMNIDGSAQTNISNRLGTVDDAPDWGQVAERGPTSKAECKNGGYEKFGFKNQGQCIKAVN